MAPFSGRLREEHSDSPMGCAMPGVVRQLGATLPAAGVSQREGAASVPWPGSLRPSEESPRVPSGAQPSEPRVSAERLLEEDRPGDATGGSILCPVSQLQDGAGVKQESPAVPGGVAVPTGAPGSGCHCACGSEDQSGLVEGVPPTWRQDMLFCCLEAQGEPRATLLLQVLSQTLSSSLLLKCAQIPSLGRVSRPDPEAGPTPVCSEGIWNVPVSTFPFRTGTP